MGMLVVTLERLKGKGSCLQGELTPTSEEVEVGFSFWELGSWTPLSFLVVSVFLLNFM